jgi:Ca-activated chloride channel family protein
MVRQRSRTRRIQLPAALALLLGLAVAAWPVPAALAAPEDDELSILPAREPAGSPFLLRETRVRTVVTGPVARVAVTQKWANPNSSPVDGLYIFPLPEEAAVSKMSLRIGDRIVQGEMKRRDEARAIYEEARRQGRMAGLLDQERPNIFAQRVANIMPGVAIDVVIEFDHPIECEASRCEYVFPTVVGPRFIPAEQVDPGHIDPPVVAKGSGTGQRLYLTLDLDAGVSLHRVGSPSHQVHVTRRGSDGAKIVLADEASRKLDRDFRLRWSVGSDRPELGLLAWRDVETTGGPGHFTLILQPPEAPDDSQAAPRELVFVLDCSGSMSGVPIEATKNVVRRALRAVRPGDTFQIIRFSERASGLGAEPLKATPANIQRALGYLDSLRGQGGTRMLEGIRAALARPADPERIRIVAFLTDGYIGNEGQILGEVQRLIGSARLFSFGIGSSVNRYLLEGLAEEGRGVAAFLGPRETPDEMVDRFIRRIETPVLTDLRITWEDLEVEDLEPAKIPDLFAGQSVLIHGRYTRPGTGVVVVEGRRRGHWESLRRVAVLHEDERDNEALGRLWARARIHRLQRQLHGGSDERIVEAITELGLRHHLVTAWTSLVAVDSEIVNGTGTSTPMEVPVEMPQGVSYEGVFGGQTAAMGMKRAAPGSSMLKSFGSVVRTMGSPPPQASVSPALSERREEVDGLQRADEAKETFFSQVVLHRADGARLVVEADGEVWLHEGNRRALLKTLSVKDLSALRRLIALVGASSWGDETTSGERLVIRGDWGRASRSLPATDPGVLRLAEMLEGWAS